MDSDWRGTIANALNESYKHRELRDVACALCGSRSKPLALHVISYAQDETAPLPPGFVPQSASRGTIRGAFPVCSTCAPPCAKCQLPIVTASVKAGFQRLYDTLDSEDSPVMWGNGRCEHLRLFGRWSV